MYYVKGYNVENWDWKLSEELNKVSFYFIFN